jgi:hypothetical protein
VYTAVHTSPALELLNTWREAILEHRTTKPLFNIDLSIDENSDYESGFVVNALIKEETAHFYVPVLWIGISGCVMLCPAGIGLLSISALITTYGSDCSNSSRIVSTPTGDFMAFLSTANSIFPVTDHNSIE